MFDFLMFYQISVTHTFVPMLKLAKELLYKVQNLWLREPTLKCIIPINGVLLGKKMIGHGL